MHEIDVPDYHYIDSLKKEYNSISKKDQVDVILANPPFGASIAEGVETKEQYERLIHLKCDKIQGYYFDRPLSIEVLTTKYK